MVCEKVYPVILKTMILDRISLFFAGSYDFLHHIPFIIL